MRDRWTSLGVKLTSKKTRTIAIKGYEPLWPADCDSSQLELSAAQIASLEARLSSDTPGDDVRVVGYYRSHSGAHLCLTDSDQHLINRYFADPSIVFLVVKSTNGGPAAGGFFFWGGGVVFGGFSFFEFPFDARALAPQQLAPKKPADRDGPSTPQGSAAQTVIPESEAPGAFAPTGTTTAEREESCVWTFPGCPIRVELEPQVVERLRNEVLQNTESETGGLLLGKGGPGTGGTVAIMEYEPLRLSHGDGNQFVLSAAEIASLQARLASDEGTSELKVVGYYRSHLGENLCHHGQRRPVSH